MTDSLHPSETLQRHEEQVGEDLRIPPLPVPRTTPPRSWLGRWLLAGSSTEGHAPAETKPWYLVLWLTGVDYFSTLGYQPGIALLAAGVLSPVATAMLVLVTLCGALPIYAQVAQRSYIGQGSIAMLERMFSGWKSKLVVLILIGFASTDFVITMTLSAADAAKHAVHNPLLHPFLGDAQMSVTLLLLALLAIVFLMGFTEAIGVATAVAVPYLLLNLVVVVRGGIEILRHPDLLSRWSGALALQGDWTMILLGAGLVFPRLALGLSGFETGVTVMPLVKGDPPDKPGAYPVGRIRATRKLLTAAALIMSGMLITTSFITSVLLTEAEYREDGPAAGRALAYLAHQMMGHGVGTVYDFSTILILWFAGASAMAAMLNLIPRYLPRFGMAPHWVAHTRPLVIVLFAVNVIVTLIFRADVEAQGGAYATGVLALMLSAALAVALALWHEAGATTPRRFPVASLYFWLITAVFTYTLAMNVKDRSDGVLIASAFILAVLVLSGISRYRRATELRVESIVLADEESAMWWKRMTGKKVNLVPLKHWDENSLRAKEAYIRRHYKIKGPLAFLHVYLRDDRSEFLTPLRVKVRRWQDDYIVEVTGAVAVANTIAYVSELLDPISIFLDLTGRNPMGQAFQYFLWGEGETAILVYYILLRYWAWTPEKDVRPLIFLMSE
ncbi:MAG: hypothetical protein NZT92_02425 [Abditibacteriales bacterium]|nr:hypothetical protein [Abditibacteriales bacterium]MDW8366837.1 hypothetical protein [Abditibacteriales bacterium]